MSLSGSQRSSWWSPVLCKLFLAATAHRTNDTGELSRANPTMSSSSSGHVEMAQIISLWMVSYTNTQIYLFMQISEILLRFLTVMMAFDCPEYHSSSPLLQLCCYQRHSWWDAQFDLVSGRQIQSLPLFGHLAHQFLLIRIRRQTSHHYYFLIKSWHNWL